ncbi:MAG TPA: TadE/TadG family type IV pilus assembly protein [Candidatus Sulfomarinibacteraceae bacterium]|nr:TadE/TadG family type IV pilus assembly protein [Candidatus Sulfomarinibacteraceae bacterium]
MRTRRFPSRHRKSPGQSLVEFALILPIVLTIMGAAVDMARLYGAWVALEGSTRDAAEQVATFEGLTSNYATASARARTVICSQMANVVGFEAPPGNPTNCSQPAVTLDPTTWTVSTTAAGASAKYPIGTATVTATLPFRMLFAYPFLTQDGTWTISSTQTYAIVQGRGG